MLNVPGRTCLLASLILAIACILPASAADKKAKPDVEIDPEQVIWLQLPTTTIPVQGGVHFVIIDIQITKAKNASYVCRIYPRMNEKIQFTFSNDPPAPDNRGQFDFKKYSSRLLPEFNASLQVKYVTRVRVFDGAQPKPVEEDISIMECQGSAAILRQRTQLRDLLRRQR